jgi:hypothetical protein
MTPLLLSVFSRQAHILVSQKKHKLAHDVPLVPFEDFKKSVKKILSNTKLESDRQLAEFRVSNLKKREAKKRR